MKNEDIMNYFLTIGFIITIFIVLTSIIFVSRIVFLSSSPTGGYITGTKTLLEDISEVKEIIKSQNKTIKDNEKYITIGKHFSITDISYSNINKNKSVITFIFDERILDINNEIFYTLTKDLSNLEKEEQIIYNKNQIGEIRNIDNDEYDLLNLETKNIETINIKNIEGVVFLNLQDENN